MANRINIVVFFRNSDGQLSRMEEYKDVESARVREGGYYEIINRGGTEIIIPLTAIDNIIRNEERG